MSRDRFNGTPLEDAVRHNFDVRNAEAIQKTLRDHGATLAGEGLDYVSAGKREGEGRKPLPEGRECATLDSRPPTLF